jgi:hypothetical protein
MLSITGESMEHAYADTMSWLKVSIMMTNSEIWRRVLFLYIVANYIRNSQIGVSSTLNVAKEHDPVFRYSAYVVKNRRFSAGAKLVRHHSFQPAVIGSVMEVPKWSR